MPAAADRYHPAEGDKLLVATPRVAAGVLFRDAAGRVLLVKPTYKDGWEIPGGYVERGESPHAAAVALRLDGRREGSTVL